MLNQEAEMEDAGCRNASSVPYIYIFPGMSNHSLCISDSRETFDELLGNKGTFPDNI